MTVQFIQAALEPLAPAEQGVHTAETGDGGISFTRRCSWCVEYAPQCRELIGHSAADVGRRRFSLGLLVVGVVLAVFASLAPSGPGAAQDGDAAQSIQGRVQDRFLDDDGDAVLVPVADVRIIVEDESGTVVGEAFTDADGTYRDPTRRSRDLRGAPRSSRLCPMT